VRYFAYLWKIKTESCLDYATAVCKLIFELQREWVVLMWKNNGKVQVVHIMDREDHDKRYKRMCELRIEKVKAGRISR